MIILLKKITLDMTLFILDQCEKKLCEGIVLEWKANNGMDGRIGGTHSVGCEPPLRKLQSLSLQHCL